MRAHEGSMFHEGPPEVAPDLSQEAGSCPQPHFELWQSLQAEKKNCKSWKEQTKVNCQELLKFGLTPTLLELRYHPLGRKKIKEGQAVRGLGGWT